MTWSVQSQIDYIEAHIEQQGDPDNVWVSVIGSLRWLLSNLTERVNDEFSPKR